MKRVEVIAVVMAGLLLSYLLGFHDGARIKHRTSYAEVVQ